MRIRLFSLLMVLLLACPCALAQTQTFSGLFSLTFDENRYDPDMTSWLGESGDAKRWLMMLSADTYLLDVMLTRAEGWEHLSLTGGRGAMLDWYVDSMTRDGFEWVETVEADGADFGVFRASDADGEYLLGETVVSGWTVSFYAYYDDPARPADEELASALRELLITYQPCR